MCIAHYISLVNDSSCLRWVRFWVLRPQSKGMVRRMDMVDEKEEDYGYKVNLDRVDEDSDEEQFEDDISDDSDLKLDQRITMAMKTR